MKNRNIALCIIFSIITFGIYGIYWFICLTNEYGNSGRYLSDLRRYGIFILIAYLRYLFILLELSDGTEDW